MAAKCGFCRSCDVLACAGDNVCCVNCGKTGPNAEGTPLPDATPVHKPAKTAAHKTVAKKADK